MLVNHKTHTLTHTYITVLSEEGGVSCIPSIRLRFFNSQNLSVNEVHAIRSEKQTDSEIIQLGRTSHSTSVDRMHQVE